MLKSTYLMIPYQLLIHMLENTYLKKLSAIMEFLGTKLEFWSPMELRICPKWTILLFLKKEKSVNRVPIKVGFQLADLIITELKDHMTSYKFECSHWWKIYL